MDRLGRSLRHLIDMVAMLAERDVGFVSLQESIDTTTPGGRLAFHVFAALAEFERDLIRARTSAGLAAARVRGRKGGRPSVMTPDKLAIAREMYASGDHTVAAIAARRLSASAAQASTDTSLRATLWQRPTPPRPPEGTRAWSRRASSLSSSATRLSGALRCCGRTSRTASRGRRRQQRPRSRQDVLTAEDRRGLTALFWARVGPYGEITLNMTKRPALSANDTSKFDRKTA